MWVTALKQAKEASILEERNRMAREIHDTLAQSFTGILAQVGAAKQILAIANRQKPRCKPLKQNCERSSQP
ncbi:MAG TPA: histidine kinase, partial [Phototrophicaceae bacterium]|nr:histidine kinase [Phototrophicaceae bacterium]